MDEYLAESEVIYPDDSILEKGVSYLFLPAETNRLMDSLFMEIRIAGGGVDEEDGGGNAWPIVLTFAGLAVAAAFLFLPKPKHKRK
jgi:hypothetical protein